MTDIVERLRKGWRECSPDDVLEAADEIERLTAENAMLRDAILKSDDAHWTPAMRAALTAAKRDE